MTTRTETLTLIIGRPPLNGEIVAELQSDDGHDVLRFRLSPKPFRTLAELALAFRRGKSILFLRCGSRHNAETRVCRINKPVKKVLGGRLVACAGGGTYHLTNCRHVRILSTIALYAPHHLPDELVEELLCYSEPVEDC